MAQSSAAREPTMEEILASIRRIIESNDESAPPRVEQRPQLASIAANAPAAEAVSIDAASITEARPAEPEKPAEAAPARAISLADVAARLRSRDERPAPAADRPLLGANDDPASANDAPEDDDDDIPAVTLDPLDTIFENEAEEPLTDASDDEEPAEEDEVPASAAALSFEEQRAPVFAARDSRDFEAVRPEGKAAQPNEADTSESAAETTGSSALVSAETGTKVAAAFDDLNTAIAEGRMRSFEELAQELLRPMLSEWLDDNLPTLVERLVREEIERVARGGRR